MPSRDVFSPNFAVPLPLLPVQILSASTLCFSYAIPRRSRQRTSYAVHFLSNPLLILSVQIVALPLRDRSHLSLFKSTPCKSSALLLQMQLFLRLVSYLSAFPLRLHAQPRLPMRFPRCSYQSHTSPMQYCSSPFRCPRHASPCKSFLMLLSSIPLHP